MNAIAVIQARMSSSRLSGKVLMPLADRPMIWHIYQRASRCSQVKAVVVATSTESSDDALARFCAKNEMLCHRGPLNNVMHRFLEVHSQFPDSKYVVRITGDCPLIHPEFIDNQIQALDKFGGDLIHINNTSDLLCGQGVHSWSSLEYINTHSKDADDKEHVGSPYISMNLEQFKLVKMTIPKIFQSNKFRITVDEPQDYELMYQLYNALWNEKSKFIDLYQAISWLKSHPRVADINQKVEHSAINKKVQNHIKNYQNLNVAGKWKYVTS